MMSMVNAQKIRPGHMSEPPQAPSIEHGWICLRSSPTLSRLAAVEMLADQELALTDDVRQALQRLTLDQSAAQDKLLRLWVQVDVGRLAMTTKGQEDQSRRDGALRILVCRQANYPLLRRLFKLSRDRWQELRVELSAPPALRAAAVPSGDTVDQIYACWSRLLKELDDDVDRWVVLAESFPKLPILALDRLISLGGEDEH
jgi:hypothetical protein